jgi:diphthamide biosynthesis protein 4
VSILSERTNRDLISSHKRTTLHDSAKLDCSQQNYYQLLHISPSLSLSSAEVKAAYYRVLLKSHPDKSRSTSIPIYHQQEQGQQNQTITVDIAQLKEAYITLSSPHLRAEYDLKLFNERSNDGNSGRGPRPAQIISLGEFDERSEGFWHHACRCGGEYIIGEQDMEKEYHLVGCNSCSEVIWVGYEVAEEDIEAKHNDVLVD